MKKLSTLSLFIFGVVVTAILVAGLVFYQNGKNSQILNNQTGSKVSNTVTQLESSGKSLVLNMAEISKHNKESDCWMLISGKVYDISGFFGSHPGGNGTMTPDCGKDATSAYDTKDPYATSTSGGRSHTSRAQSMLTDYYIGDFNQTINPATKTVNTNSNVTSPSAKSTKTTVVTTKTTTPTKPAITPTGNITLSIAEIAKHNSASNCWMLISGKVYNITSFFGSHPGGNGTMTPDCGKDATAAYMTKDPYATSTSGGGSHSSNAVSLLASYYIGNLNQTIGQQQITQTSTVVPPTTNNREWDD